MLYAASFTLLIIEAARHALDGLRHRLTGERSLAESVTIIDAPDIREAIDVITATPPDVVLLHLEEGADAVSSVRRLRKAAAHVPIVISTDAAHESLAFEAVQSGGQDYVITDLEDARVIWRVIRHALDRAALDARRETLLIREHDARLAADEAREDADRARANAEALERRATFLADASIALSTTLDPQTILATATQLAVPRLAHGVAAFVADDSGVLSLIKAAEQPPRDAARALAFVRRLVGQEPLARVLTRARRQGCVVLDGRPLMTRAGPEPTPASEAVSTAHCVLVPLRARERPLGLLLFIMGDGRRTHDPADLALIEAFASRVAMAVDNACLFEASQRAIRTRDLVLGIVSHDLRNPLSAIAMCATALRRSEHMRPDERQRLVAAIHDAVGWTQRLLGDLVDVTSIEAGRLSMDAYPIDPIMLLGKSLDLFDTDPGGVAVRLPPDVPEFLPTIVGDEQRILQVLGNLISNARKFSRPGGSITLGAAVVGGMLRFSVSDTGSGIAREDQPHIFDWFWRVARDRAERGAGLGLAIAKGIVNAHGGDIAVASSPGNGATFSFTIPLELPVGVVAATAGARPVGVNA